MERIKSAWDSRTNNYKRESSQVNINTNNNNKPGEADTNVNVQDVDETEALDADELIAQELGETKSQDGNASEDKTNEQDNSDAKSVSQSDAPTEKNTPDLEDHGGMASASDKTKLISSGPLDPILINKTWFYTIFGMLGALALIFIIVGAALGGKKPSCTGSSCKSPVLNTTVIPENKTLYDLEGNHDKDIAVLLRTHDDLQDTLYQQLLATAQQIDDIRAFADEADKNISVRIENLIPVVDLDRKILAQRIEELSEAIQQKNVIVTTKIAELAVDISEEHEQLSNAIQEAVVKTNDLDETHIKDFNYLWKLLEQLDRILDGTCVNCTEAGSYPYSCQCVPAPNVTLTTSVPTTTKEITTTVPTTTEEITTTVPTTTEEITTVVPTTEEITTIVPTTKKVTTTVPTITEEFTTIVPTTEEITTIVPTTKKVTTTVPTTTNEITTTEPPTTDKITITVPTTTKEAATTVPATTKEIITTVPTTTEEITTTLPTTTEEITTIMPATTEDITTAMPQTTEEITIATPQTIGDFTTMPTTTAAPECQDRPYGPTVSTAQQSEHDSTTGFTQVEMRYYFRGNGTVIGVELNAGSQGGKNKWSTDRSLTVGVYRPTDVECQFKVVATANLGVVATEGKHVFEGLYMEAIEGDRFGFYWSNEGVVGYADQAYYSYAPSTNRFYCGGTVGSVDGETIDLSYTTTSSYRKYAIRAIICEMIYGEVNVTANPIDPAPGQTYSITVDHPGPGTIFMELDGTDAWVQTQTCTNPDGAISCTITVPGASAGVEDVMAIYYIDLNDNKTYLTSVTMVF